LKSKRADIRMRFFSQGSEEPLSGHAAIGAIWCLSERGELGGVPASKHRLESPTGILPFTVEEQMDGSKRIWLTQKRPMFAREGEVKEVASALGTGVDSLFHEQFPMMRVSTGIPYLIVPVRSIEQLGRLEPRKDELAAMIRELDVAGVDAFSWGVLEEGSTVHSRCFVPRVAGGENPGSGTAAGALGSYLVENEFIPREKAGDIVIEQGHWLGRPSKVFVRTERRSGSIIKIEVGGHAKVSMAGKLRAV
ncbi:MAG TPA: PhzF family phenazine biosynthesis protein, partial [Thermoplasmata archaeon]|nr:PhzF family phenazine biosynthesis protein [Thermoplasmata archaeon]